MVEGEPRKGKHGVMRSGAALDWGVGKSCVGGWMDEGTRCRA